MSRPVPSYMNSKPYMDKISNNAHTPAYPGGHDFNSVTNFPSLKHTGIKSAFEKSETPVIDSEGKLTMKYRVEALKRIVPILHADSDLKNKEVVFKQHHKQFLDKVLTDLEDKKRDQTERRMRHWTGSKSKLGFSSTFSSFDGTAMNVINTHEPFNADMQCEPVSNSRSESPQDKFVRFTADTQDHRSSPTTAHYNASSSNSNTAKPRKKYKPKANRIKLFEYLLENTQPPASPSGTRRFGSLSRESITGSSP